MMASAPDRLASHRRLKRGRPAIWESPPSQDPCRVSGGHHLWRPHCCRCERSRHAARLHGFRRCPSQFLFLLQTQQTSETLIVGIRHTSRALRTCGVCRHHQHARMQNPASSSRLPAESPCVLPASEFLSRTPPIPENSTCCLQERGGRHLGRHRHRRSSLLRRRPCHRRAGLQLIRAAHAAAAEPRAHRGWQHHHRSSPPPARSPARGAGTSAAPQGFPVPSCSPFP